MDRGYVVQQSCQVGQVAYQNHQNLQHNFQVGIQNNHHLYQVGDQLLLSSKIQKLTHNNNWQVVQVGTLTTNHFTTIPIKQITKLKMRKQGLLGKKFVMKIVIRGKNDQFFAIPFQYYYQWIYKTFWAVLVKKSFYSDPNQQFINSCDGQIMKKGQFLGGWQTRYVIITLTSGLMSFRSRNQEPTLKISQTNQVWTRFQIIQQNGQNWVVIKLWHGFIKEQFGVPIQRATKWIKAFYSLLKIQRI